MRREYKLTQEQLNELLAASQPVPYMVIGGIEPRSPQETANAAWKALGKELGFDWRTVQPVAFKSNEYFTAETINETGA